MNKEELVVKVLTTIADQEGLTIEQKESTVAAIVEALYEEEEAECLESANPIYSEILRTCYSQYNLGDISLLLIKLKLSHE